MAFEDCISLKNITLPKNLQNISLLAFPNQSLTSLNILNFKTQICAEYKPLPFLKNITCNVSKSSLKRNGIVAKLIDGRYSISWDKKTEITHLTIPSLIDNIPAIKVESGAFNDCHSLKYVIISDNVSTIG